MSTLLRRLADLGRSDDDLVAGELREASSAYGCQPIDEAPEREIVAIAGRVTAVTLRPRATVPALVAELYDGSHVVQLVWLGRRRIIGIDPGAYVRARGLLCRPGGRATIYNPAYELLPGHGC